MFIVGATDSLNMELCRQLTWAVELCYQWAGSMEQSVCATTVSSM